MKLNRISDWTLKTFIFVENTEIGKFAFYADTDDKFLVEDDDEVECEITTTSWRGWLRDDRVDYIDQSEVREYAHLPQVASEPDDEAIVLMLKSGSYCIRPLSWS